MSIEIVPGLTYYTRAEWGANNYYPRLGGYVARTARTKVIRHHTVIIDNDATPDLWEDLAEIFWRMRQLQTIRPDLGTDVPYNDISFWRADGSIVICEGRGHDRTGAHTGAWGNVDGIALGAQGDFTRAEYDIVPFLERENYYWGWLKRSMTNLGNVHPDNRLAWGHREAPGSGTSCPGEALFKELGRIQFIDPTEWGEEDDLAFLTQEEWENEKANIRFLLDMCVRNGIWKDENPNSGEKIFGQEAYEYVRTRMANEGITFYLHDQELYKDKHAKDSHGGGSGPSEPRVREIAAEEAKKVQYSG